jgi:hypothetical protein
MTEPLFFDCLTDAQVWSLFDAGVLQGGRLPVGVYERLARLAPDHGCYLFAWPAGVELPSLQDLGLGVVGWGEEPRMPGEQMRAAIEAFCARMHTAIPPEGGRIHVIVTNPRPELRAGPYLEPRAHDLHAMSLPELEAYLDEVLRVDEGHDGDSAAALANDDWPVATQPRCQ